MKTKQSLKQYLKDFAREEDGSEIVEWCIIVAIVAILAGAAFMVVKIVYNQIQNAGDSISKLDYNSISGGGGEAGGDVGELPAGGDAE